MMTRLILTKTLCIMVIILFSQPALAIMIGLSTEQLTKASRTVIMGQVEDVNSQWNEAGDRIVTRATVAVEEIIRGDLNEGQVIVEYEGGEVGEIGLKVSDSPSLIKGENVILVLEPKKETRDGLIRKIVGKAQGKYSIGEDGIARKIGFKVIRGKNVIDTRLPVNELVDRIRGVK